MPKPKIQSIKILAGAVLVNQRDADEYRKALKNFASSATSSKQKARNTLHALGTHTKSGRLTKQYSK